MILAYNTYRDVAFDEAQWNFLRWMDKSVVRDMSTYVDAYSTDHTLVWVGSQKNMERSLDQYWGH